MANKKTTSSNKKKTGDKSKKGSPKRTPPKVLGKKKPSAQQSRSDGPKDAVKKPLQKSVGSPAKSASKKRHRSATGSAAKVNIAGRHAPKNLRYKTGWWRPVRQSWMSDEVWNAFKAINRFRNKMMTKGMRTASLGKQIFGKEGPGHSGYGTGRLQTWADKVLRRGDGTDPHMVDLTKWFAGAASALDYHNGRRDFDDLVKAQKNDADHFMRKVLERFQESIPGLKKLSKRGISDIIRHKFYTAQYGPDGRAK